jgi:hypothetical protein
VAVGDFTGDGIPGLVTAGETLDVLPGIDNGTGRVARGDGVGVGADGVTGGRAEAERGAVFQGFEFKPRRRGPGRALAGVLASAPFAAGPQTGRRGGAGPAGGSAGTKSVREQGV